MTDQFESTYLVAGSKPWSKTAFDEVILQYPGEWHFAGTRAELTVDRIRALKPRYIFFFHWSWLVPDEVVNEFECVCFHMTDLPYGRGGSPLQNLIVRGHRKTMLSALRMTSKFDTGPVYLKEELSLEGCAEEIFIRATYLSAQLIGRFVGKALVPVAQVGEPEVFRRRTPAESEIATLDSLHHLHDFIRMLDAEGYPKAFLLHNGFRYEFNRGLLYHGRIVADVTITCVKKET